jgi:2-aminoethylphosphonate--pyruvate transaminase/phosphonoacetaldehyde hydrolase
MGERMPAFTEIRAVILDWAGTAVDFGSIAPAEAFARAFQGFGIEVEARQIRAFMGLAKLDHVRALFALPELRAQWFGSYGREPAEEDVRQVYAAVESALLAAASERCDLVPGLLEFVGALRKEGIRIGGTTGYSEKVMARVVDAAARRGYSVDWAALPREGLAGRPAPWMMQECARELGVYPMSAVVKIGDTPADMEEARNAGAWAVGVSMSGNQCGLGLDEYEALPRDRAREIRRAAEASLRAAGAHFVVDGVWDCLAVLGKIEGLLRSGASPDSVPDNPYLLLTPGPLSTSKGVRAAMLRDWCTWDRDYNDMVQALRSKLLAILGPAASSAYSAVPMQGSGSFSVEAALTSFVPRKGKLLVLANGAYGLRMAESARRCGIATELKDFGELAAPDPEELDSILRSDPEITHVGAVHVETTTGMQNPAAALARTAKARGRVFILDAMSSFGGIPMDVESVPADVFVSSANKCLQGVPGFGFVIARKELLAASEGRAGSLSLDLFDQWRSFEDGGGKWRFTSPTHVVRALAKALEELDEEGGVEARNARFRENRDVMLEELGASGFRPLLPEELRSPIITSILYPEDPEWSFEGFYAALKARGFVLYPGKVSRARTFRVGTIGHVFPADFRALGAALREASD